MTGKVILCPTRGGKASYPNQDRAIQIAKERDADILFLYVNNVQFLGMTALQKVVDIEAELDEMGDFLLAMAQERAQKAGVKASTTVRRGNFQTVLQEIIKEQPISTIVVGLSAQNTGQTTQEYINDLASELSSAEGVELILVDKGEIVTSYKSE